jgi:hypothetical protein
MNLVKKHLKPFGLIKTDVEKGISGGGDQAAPYIYIGNLYFEVRGGYDMASRRQDRYCEGIFPILPTSHRFGKSARYWIDCGIRKMEIYTSDDRCTF